VQNEENPAISQAFVSSRSARGQLGAPRAVPATQEVFDLGFDGAALELLTGTAAGGMSCCDSVGALRLQGGRFGRLRTLVAKLAGPPLGALTAVPPKGLLAAIATDRGVWVSQSRAAGRFSASRRLSAQIPWAVATVALPGGRTTVAWTATDGHAATSGPNQIIAASGAASSSPRRPRVAITLGGGRQIDELALVQGGGAATATWIESWFDRGGGYRSQVALSDLGGHPKAFPVTGQLASGLMAVGDRHGDQVVAWKSCTTTPSCTVRAAVRSAGGRFGPPTTLGAIDASEAPAATISPRGEALVGWVTGGHVVAAARTRAAAGFSAARVVSSASDATEPALAFGPGREALAVWTEGTAAPQLVGAAYRSP
jgi:hypothetical protein